MLHIVPNFTNMNTKQVTEDGIEPAIWSTVYDSIGYEKGTYTATASHVYRGFNSTNGPNIVFSRLSDEYTIENMNKRWMSRINSNNYNKLGKYQGDVKSIVNGTDIFGEYISIQLPKPVLSTSYVISHTNISSWVIAGSNDNHTFELVDIQLNYIFQPQLVNIPIQGEISDSNPPKIYNINETPLITIQNKKSYLIYKIIITEILPIERDMGFGAFINTWNLFS